MRLEVRAVRLDIVVQRPHKAVIHQLRQCRVCHDDGGVLSRVRCQRRIHDFAGFSSVVAGEFFRRAPTVCLGSPGNRVDCRKIAGENADRLTGRTAVRKRNRSHQPGNRSREGKVSQKHVVLPLLDPGALFDHAPRCLFRAASPGVNRPYAPNRAAVWLTNVWRIPAGTEIETASSTPALNDLSVWTLMSVPPVHIEIAVASQSIRTRRRPLQSCRCRRRRYPHP